MTRDASSAPPAVAENPLAKVHERAGVRWGMRQGRTVPAAYDDPAAEAAALAAGRALVDRTGLDLVELAGADRLRFLNGLVTCEVKELAPGASAYGFFTSREGRVLADVTVLALPEALWLVLPPATAVSVVEHLAKYVIADRVELRPLERTALTLSAAAAERLGAAPSGAARVAVTTVGGIESIAARAPVAGLPAVTFWATAEDAAALWQALRAGAEVRPIGHDALDAVRVERGVPLFGRDYTSDCFPQETGREAEAVSYTKGCYLGQEVVARIHYRGQANRTMRGLLLPSPPPAAGATLRFDGRPLGTIGSVAHAPTLDRPIALALLHRRGAEPGTAVELEDGRRAEVAALPFVPVAATG